MSRPRKVIRMPEEKNTDVEEHEIETQTANSEEAESPPIDDPSEVSEAEASNPDAESGELSDTEAFDNLKAEYEAYKVESEARHDPAASHNCGIR